MKTQICFGTHTGIVYRMFPDAYTVQPLFRSLTCKSKDPMKYWNILGAGEYVFRGNLAISVFPVGIGKVVLRKKCRSVFHSQTPAAYSELRCSFPLSLTWFDLGGVHWEVWWKSGTISQLDRLPLTWWINIEEESHLHCTNSSFMESSWDKE